MTEEAYWRTDHGMVRTDKPLRERHPDDFYPTPEELCFAILGKINRAAGLILDPGCGTGTWGIAARKHWSNATIIGVETDQDRLDRAWQAEVYDGLYRADYLEFGKMDGVDLIIGNPPYQLAEEFVLKSADLLAEHGILVFLLRLAFLESQGRYKRLYSQNLRPTEIHSLVERPSFTGDGRTDATAYAAFIWHKRNMHPFAPPTVLKWLSWR